MKIQVRCSHCSQTLQTDQPSGPVRLRCPQCKNIFQIGAEPPLPPVPETPLAFSPQPARTRTQKSGVGKWIWVLVAAVVGVVIIIPALLCGVFLTIAPDRDAPAENLVENNSQNNSATVAPPQQFPDLGSPVQTLDGNVMLYSVGLTGPKPGQDTQLKIYMPPGNHTAQSLAAVLVAPAGTPLLYGSDVNVGDYHDEFLPYAQAGMVTVLYSIDGDVPDDLDQRDENSQFAIVSGAYPKFKDAGGGVANGRNALEYALEKIPAINASRIYTAGHSSAGTLSLMLASQESRVAGCIAFAPSYSPEKRMADLINDPSSSLLFPGVAKFLKWYSPMNHIGDFSCPLFIFHAADDGNVPVSDARQFTQKLKAAGANVTYREVARGGHYQPMIQDGIPSAIKWIDKNR